MKQKTIGLIGGMSWGSTALYYKLINQHVGAKLGNLHSASILMYSYDFEPIKVLQYAERWDLAGNDLAQTALRLQAGGADCIVIGTNTSTLPPIVSPTPSTCRCCTSPTARQTG